MFCDCTKKKVVAIQKLLKLFNVVNINRQAKTNMTNQYTRNWRIYIRRKMRNVLKLNWVKTKYRSNGVFKGNIGNGG